MRTAGDRSGVQDDRLAGGAGYESDRPGDVPDLLPLASDAEIRRELYGSDLKRHLLGLLHPRSIRPLVRIGAIAAWTGAGLAILLGGMWATTPWPARRRAWRNRIVKRWARGVCRIVGAETMIEGTPPAAPFFLVANHLSYADIIVLLAELDGVFVASGSSTGGRSSAT